MDLSRPALGSSVMRRQAGTARPVELLRGRGAGMPPRDDPHRLNHPYRNGFSGRDVCKTSNNKHVSHHRSTDSNWLLRGPHPDGSSGEIDVVYLVEMMIHSDHGWDTIKEWEIQEESMPAAKKIMDLFGEDGQPLNLSDSPEDVHLLMGACHLGTYPSWIGYQTGPNDYRQGDEDVRQLPVTQRLFVPKIAQLEHWANTGVAVAGGHMGPSTVKRPFGVEIVNGAYKNAGKLRSIRNVGDPVGLVADKLGRAIANERREGGKATYNVHRQKD